ncbi:hypothetical protein P167DRAFT_579802 [Morchella conica CCBAS932]|uniref:Uncharacterized protein n=1 Tax=Morchella conica CCBAS932 TaxID=1392247 RepID=A0A3N4KBY0_9PEZI|nr:hypothetical protein P167DRAFT_579802 [Morchella conica CCBAS932]
MPESITVNVRQFWSEANVNFNTNITLIDSAKSAVQIASLRVRLHLVFAIKDFVAKGLLYGLKYLTTPETRADKVNHLVENDRFISDPDNYAVLTGRDLGAAKVQEASTNASDDALTEEKFDNLTRHRRL